MAALASKHYTEASLGRLFMGTTAVAGAKPPAYNATAHTFCLWNPAGSGKNIVPIRLAMGFVDTTGAAGNVVLSYQSGVGAQAATGSPITAFTHVAPINCLVGSGKASIAKFAPAAATFAAGTSLLRTTGISELVTTATDATNMYSKASEDFDGTLIVPPGTAICVAGNIALLSNFDITLIWAEIDED